MTTGAILVDSGTIVHWSTGPQMLLRHMRFGEISILERLRSLSLLLNQFFMKKKYIYACKQRNTGNPANQVIFEFLATPPTEILVLVSLLNIPHSCAFLDSVHRSLNQTQKFHEIINLILSLALKILRKNKNQRSSRFCTYYAMTMWNRWARKNGDEFCTHLFPMMPKMEDEWLFNLRKILV